MPSNCNRDLDSELTAVSARLQEIVNTPYDLKLPKYTEAEEEIAKGVAKISSKMRSNRRLMKTEDVNSSWTEAFSLDHICIWAMSGKYDPFDDLLNDYENGSDAAERSHRTCLPGVSLVEVERRKALLAEALDAYAAEIRAQKMKRERGR